MDCADRLITRREVSHLTGLCRSALRAREAKGQFPRRIKATRTSCYWSAREVAEWIEEQLKARDAA